MPSIPCFVVILALIFATQVESRAFPLAEATDAKDLRARQVATSAAASATDVGSIVAGNIQSLLALGASMSSASVEVAMASASAVASTMDAEHFICNADSNRNQTAWIEFNVGDWFKNQYVNSPNSLSSVAVDCFIEPNTIPSITGTTWMELLSRTFKN